MEIEGGDEEARTFPPSENRRPPDPVFVMRRYWKSLASWSVIVFVLVLVATLTPLFILRDEGAQEEKNKASLELIKAETGLRNVIRLAFVPAASLGLWVTGEPNFLHQVGSTSPQLVIETEADSYEGCSPFQQAAKKALEVVSPQMYDGTIRNLQLAPHGVVSALFPLSFGQVKALGHNLLNDTNRRREALATIFSRGFALAGPFPTIQGGMGLVARLPVFYEATNCSCRPSSSTTANEVTFRTPDEFPDSLQEIEASNVSLSSYFSYGKLGDHPENFSPETLTVAAAQGRGFPAEVVYDAGEGELLTMFCDPSPEKGLMGLELGDFGIRTELNMSVGFLPQCNFFWGFANVFFDFKSLIDGGGFLDGVENAGFSYSLSKIEKNGEVFILFSFSVSFLLIIYYLLFILYYYYLLFLDY